MGKGTPIYIYEIGKDSITLIPKRRDGKNRLTLNYQKRVELIDTKIESKQKMWPNSEEAFRKYFKYVKNYYNDDGKETITNKEFSYGKSTEEKFSFIPFEILEITEDKLIIVAHFYYSYSDREQYSTTHDFSTYWSSNGKTNGKIFQSGQYILSINHNGEIPVDNYRIEKF